MAKPVEVHFTVTGHTRFPLDMLRYDCCYPKHEAQSYDIVDSIQHQGSPPWQIELIRRQHRDDNPQWMPTIGRWTSFGWTVDQESIRRVS